MALHDIRIVLIEPQHPGNIGAVARAMKTMSLSHLVLVRPRDFPSYEAERRAAGADDILKRAEVVEDLGSAIGDCRLVVGCSARNRGVRHEMLDARQCGAKLIEETVDGVPAALLFGTERTGLENHDLDRCNYQVMIPANPTFSSLNLASAVQLVCYEIFVAAGETTLDFEPRPEELPCREEEMENFFEHLIRALDSREFLEGQMRESGIMKIRRLFGRSRPSLGEVKMLRSLARLIHKDGE
jgi:tRNA (cytidine32/uridine32-2'-O)-methyltransferase